MLSACDFSAVAKVFFVVHFCKRAGQRFFFQKELSTKILRKIIVNLEELSGKMMFPWSSCLASL